MQRYLKPLYIPTTFMCLMTSLLWGGGAAAKPSVGAGIPVHLGALQITPIRGYSAHGQKFGSISAVYIIMDNPTANCSFKCVRLSAPAGIKPGDHFQTPLEMKRFLLHSFRTEGNRDIKVSAKPVNWGGLTCVDLQWQYVDKLGRHYWELERTFVTLHSTYQIYGLLLDIRAQTGQEIKLIQNRWRRQLKQISITRGRRSKR